MANLFTSSFETADLSEYTSSSGTSTVQSTLKHHGKYALQCTGTNWVKAVKTFTAQDVVYARFYVYFSAFPAAGSVVSLAELYLAGSTDILVVGVKNDGGTYKWGCTYPDDSYSATPNPTTGTWYLVEIKVDKNTERRIYVDGVSVWSGALNNVQCDALVVGKWDNYSDSMTVTVDSVSVATSTNGADTAYPYIQKTSDVDSTADIGAHSAFTNQMAAADATYNTLTESSTVLYTELAPAVFAPANTDWQNYDIYTTNGVPKGAVAEIVVYNLNASAEYIGGVRTDGSALNRYLTIHEAEGGGISTCTFYVKVDSSTGLIETYANNTTNIRFALIGYWTGVDFTEAWGQLTAAGTGSFEDERLAQANRVYAVTAVNAEETTNSMGVRTDGSAIDRRFNMHEAEAGGVHAMTWIVKTDGDGDIEIYVADTTNNYFYNQGYFGSELDFVEKWSKYDAGSTGWQDADLTADLDQDGRYVSFYCAHGEAEAEYYCGVRANGGAVGNRYLQVHESEEAATSTDNSGFNGFTATAKSDSSGIVDVYVPATATDYNILLGYFKGENYLLAIEEQFTEVPYGSLSAPRLHVVAGAYSSPAETLNVQVWDSTNSEWDALGAVTASQDNSYSLAGYAAANVYIRFVDGTTSSDSFPSTWQIDSVYISDSYPKTFTVGAELQAGTTTYTKTFSANAELIKSLTKTFSANGELTKNLTKTFSIGGELYRVGTKTFSANIELIKSLSKTFSFNGELLKASSKGFTVGAELLLVGTKAFSVNAELLKSGTASFTLDAELTKSLSKALSFNAELTKTYTKTFSANAELIQSLTKTFTVNAELTQNLTQSFTFNAELIRVYTVSFTAAAELESVAPVVGPIQQNASYSRRRRVNDLEFLELMKLYLEMKLETA